MLEAIAVPAFADNYIWLLPDNGQRHVAVVDPGDAEPVIAACERLGATPNAILITHRHRDHVGGIEQLKARYPGLKVYGPAHEPIPAIDVRLRDGDVVKLAEQGLRFTVWEVPGHTEGHIVYVGEGALFCGDTLFGAGCGRVFTGDHVAMHASLARLRELPGDTAVYCAHEYTLDNIGFAKWVEPDNLALLQRERDSQAAIDADRATVPSTIALERATNPFLRFDVPGVRAMAARHADAAPVDDAEVFRALREWKDREYD
ncbi:MAG: hydroxyacylglutathione hydrolase [Gammaproteobacteria bacterium]|nr:hydroxyacylglutathione hydrolase [Gammaproteobacteria bacterium]